MVMALTPSLGALRHRCCLDRCAPGASLARCVVYSKFIPKPIDHHTRWYDPEQAAMYRLFLFLAPTLIRYACWLGPLWMVPFAVLYLVLDARPLWLLAAGVLTFPLLFYRYWLHLLAFGRAIRRFDTVRGTNVVLCHAPAAAAAIDASRFVQRSEEALADFSCRFGFTLKRRLVIYLFATAADVRRIFKIPAGGCALIRGDAVVLAPGASAGGQLEEVLCHELAHLFSARWGQLDPPLKGEGLATWAMRTVDGKPIDFHALIFLLTDRYLFLIWLTDWAWFYGSMTNSYLVAGSFTGYLIRRFGWQRYRDFFERAGIKNFETCFEQVFGLSLLSAERLWRDDLLERRASFEPELTRLIGQRRVETAYSAGHVYRCLEEADVLCRAGEATGKVLWYAAATRAYLGHYDIATTLMEQALASDDPWVQSIAGQTWLQLANLYDLRGRRDEAVAAYERSLRETDYWRGWAESTHALARRYLGRPFTEDDIQQGLRKQTQLDRGSRKPRRGSREQAGQRGRVANLRIFVDAPNRAR
jgi:hypothetical protein